jgi:hypothetical protein
VNLTIKGILGLSEDQAGRKVFSPFAIGEKRDLIVRSSRRTMFAVWLFLNFILKQITSKKRYPDAARSCK